MSEKVIVRIPDVPINIAGTRHAKLTLDFDHEPSSDEILERIHHKLSFPSMGNDNDREIYLSLCAFGAESDKGLFEEHKLNLLGNESYHAYMRSLIQCFVNIPGNERVIKEVGKKLLATLRDKEMHSYGFVGENENENYRWLVSIQTHPGKFAEVAPKLRGKHYASLLALTSPGGIYEHLSLSAILSLDYFTEDADFDNNVPFYLSLAVSFFPLRVDNLPSNYHDRLVHVEMLTLDELRELNILIE